MPDTEKEALCARIDELCAEVERLRQENQSVGMAAYELGRAGLADENAKLRELVRILYYCGLPWKDCDRCAMNGYDMHVKISDVEYCDGMYDLMRELGVVDE